MILALILPALSLALASVIIRFACDTFEPAADHLGRNFPPGVKGATINAVGSSLPELLTTFILMFAYADDEGFEAGIATCVGSSVFNLIVIPSVCVLAVSRFGVQTPGAAPRRLESIGLDRRFLFKNGIYFLFAEVILIAILGLDKLGWAAALGLIGTYVVYLISLWGVTVEGSRGEDVEMPDQEESTESPLWLLLKFDFNQLLFRGRPYNNRRAWIVLTLSVLVLAVACHLLAGAVVDVAAALGVHTYFTALILAAVATSIPDTILSVKDALKGQYDDAVANAIGSNTFDIGVGIGLPLLCYTLIYGPIHLDDVSGPAGIRTLMMVLLAITIVAMAMFLWRDRFGRKRAFIMLAMYVAFTAWILGSALDWWPVAAGSV